MGLSISLVGIPEGQRQHPQPHLKGSISSWEVTEDGEALQRLWELSEHPPPLPRAWGAQVQVGTAAVGRRKGTLGCAEAVRMGRWTLTILSRPPASCWGFPWAQARLEG